MRNRGRISKPPAGWCFRRVPLKSRLLTMPLAHEAGGTEFHPGGKHWESQNDPEWKALAAWVSAAK